MTSKTDAMTAFSTLRERYLVPVALLALFVWLLFNCFETVEHILRYYTPLPYWDYWRVPENLLRYEAFDLRAFWRQHNEHRIIFPEICFALDMMLWHGRQILPLAVSFLSYVATWLLLSSTLFTDGKLSLAVSFAATSLAGIIALWEGSTALLATPFQLQWTLMQLGVACSLLWLTCLKESSQVAYLVGVIGAAVLANYSSGNGLLLWPLLVALALLMRVKRQHTIILGVAGITFIGLYFVGYHSLGDLNLRNLLTHPLYLLEYFASYLSMPFGGMNTPEFGVRVGLGNLILTVVLFVIALRRGWLHSRAAAVLFGSYAFTLLTILITAAGRMDPADPTFTNAKPQRYITVPLMNWAVFILLCFWVSSRGRFKIASPAVIGVAFSLLLLLWLPKLRDWMALISEGYAQQQMGALSLENDVLDPNLIRRIFISVEFVESFLPELRQQHLSIYYKPRDRWLGKPLSQFSPALGKFIPGQITSAFPVRGGVQVLGWADGSALHRSSYRWVILTNEQDQIVGFGERLPAGFPSILDVDNTPPSIGWVGFVNLATPTQSISAHVVDPRRGGLYSIDGSFPAPSVREANFADAVAPIAGITWQKDAIWSSQLPALVPFGQIPPGLVYASWSGNDSNTGQLASSAFPAPKDGCIILPVLHGPKIGGLSAELSDADTNQIIASSPFQNGDTRWEYWRVPVPSSTQHLRVIARDDGKNWGEWLGVASPLTCRSTP